MSEDVYCRLCALKVEEFVKIYDEEGEKLNLSTKIIQCLQIWLYPEDILPKTICNDCCNKVDLFFDFFQICTQAQISLMAIYKDKNEEGKEMISNDLEIHEETSYDNDYEEDCTIDDEGIEEVEYTELAVSEKCTASSKRKLRTPIKHSLMDGTSLADVDLEQANCLDDDSGETREKTTSSSKSSSIGVEEGIEEDLGSEDEPKFSKRALTIGLDGYIWRCTNCSVHLKSLTELRKHHSQVHNQPPIFACMHCTKSYARYRSFARHVKMHSNPKNFSCEICGKSFSQKTVLQSHATVHSEERPHCCAQCGKTFKQFSSLYLHSKCHLPEQAKTKFPCSHCPKEFSTKHTLETHLKIHTGERNFVCDVCGKRFIAKGSLDYHIMTHSDSKPHSCTICGKGFMTVRLLKKHSTLHTGIKPHQCDVCGKQFRERGALKEHNRIHTGAMPYSCEFCGKLFRFKGILTVHIRQHTGERPYSCSECHREFTNWANYNKHMKRRHRTVEHERNLPRDAEDEIIPPPPLHAPHSSVPDYNAPNDADYKVMEEDLYRVHNYVSPMGYYIPPIQHTLLPARQ